MRLLRGQYRYFLLLVLIVVLAEWIVNPLGNFPLNDDWAYGKAVLYTDREHYTTGGFGAMTLFTHLMWGLLFTKLFGFSFTVLRFSTLVSLLIGAFFLYRLILKFTARHLIAFWICLILVFNPLCFNLANTYMTDVSFNTLLILCCYFAFRFFASGRRTSLLLFFACSLALVLLRQYGIIAPFCFMLACAVRRENRWRNLLYALSGFIVVTLVFKLYESYLSHILPPGAVYKFSGAVNPFSAEFWRIFFAYVRSRSGTILLHLFLYTAPAALLFIPPLVKGLAFRRWMSLLLACAALSGLLFCRVAFPNQNIVSNMCIGPETFSEMKGHSYSESFGQLCVLLKYVLPTVTFFGLGLYLMRRRQAPTHKAISPESVFMVSMILTYCIMILITQSYFDRYHIPLITLGLIFMVWLVPQLQPDYRWMLLPLLLFFYASVFGTRDYLTLNRIRWELFRETEKQTGLPAGKIDGGFEVNCWNDGGNNWWFDYVDTKPFDYLIQFKSDEGFRLQKAVVFQRYFPYRKDTLKLFVKDSLAMKP